LAVNSVTFLLITESQYGAEDAGPELDTDEKKDGDVDDIEVELDDEYEGMDQKPVEQHNFKG